MGKKTPKIAPSPWDCISPPEEDQAVVVGNMHKQIWWRSCVWFGRCSWTDTHTGRHIDVAHYNTSPPLPRAK